MKKLCILGMTGLIMIACCLGTKSDSVKASYDLSANESQESSNKENVRAIDFSVKDENGQEVSLLSKVGKPLVVNFWASWCPPCREEMPRMQKLYDELGDEVEFMMINMTDQTNELPEQVKQYLKEQNLTIPVYYDTHQDAAYRYTISVLPTTFFIDSEGYIIAHAKGALDEETLRYGIGMIYHK